MLFFACTQEPAGNGNLSTHDEHTVSVEAALAELHALLPEIDGTTRAGGRTVADVSLVRTSDLLPETRSETAPAIEALVYIANFENEEGYAILGADDRVPGVIAIVEQGSLTPAELAENAKDPDASLSEAPAVTQIADYLTTLGAVIGDSPVKLPPGGTLFPPSTKWEIIEKYPPLLRMKWGQKLPHNLFCPLVVNEKGETVNAPVGCMAVAIGQIFAANVESRKCWGRNISFGGYSIDMDLIHQAIIKVSTREKGSSWELIKADRSPEALEVARLLRGIGKEIGMIYHSEGSGPRDEKDALLFFEYNDMFDAVLKPYSAEEVKRMIQNDRPVYISGWDSTHTKGHAWVIDGYCRQQGNSKFPGSSFYSTRTLYHCNFGYNGEGDGYFHSGIFKIVDGPEFRDEWGDWKLHPDGVYTNCNNDLHIITYSTYN